MTVLITGASAGFGAAACHLFVQQGYRVIGAARRLEKLQQLQQQLGSNFYALPMDVSQTHSIDNALAHLPEKFANIDILVNNAGLALGLQPAQQAKMEDWLTMIHTNIIGLTYLTHQILPLMTERQKGHIINIGSIAGTYPYPGGNVYGASKAYVAQFSRNLRADLPGCGVRVTNIEPGLCGGTEFSQVRFKGDEEQVAKVYADVEYLTAQDIAETIFWVASRPPHVNINTIELMPTAQSCSALHVERK